MGMEIPQKKIRLFEAVLTLLGRNGGVNAADIRVSEIAEMADIGKGTVYEYFESKEQLMIEALQYAIERDFGETETLMLKTEGLQPRIRLLMEAVGECAKRNMPLMRWLSQSNAMARMKQEMPVRAVFSHFVELLGEEEDFASPIRMLRLQGAVISGVMHLLLYLDNTALFDGLDYGQAMELACGVTEKLLREQGSV